MSVKINTNNCSEALIKLYIGYNDTTSSDRYKVILSNLILRYDSELNRAMNIKANYFDPVGDVSSLFEKVLNENLIKNPNVIEFEQVYLQAANKIEEKLEYYIKQKTMDYAQVKENLLVNRKKYAEFEKYSENLCKLQPCFIFSTAYERFRTMIVWFVESYLLELIQLGLSLSNAQWIEMAENSNLRKIYSDILIAELDTFPKEINREILYLKEKEIIEKNLKEYFGENDLLEFKIRKVLEKKLDLNLEKPIKRIKFIISR